MTTNAAAQEASNADGRVRLYSYNAVKAWLYDEPWPDGVSEDEYISAIMPRDETSSDEWVEVPVSAAMALPHEDGRVCRRKSAQWPRYCTLGYGCWVQVRPLDKWFAVCGMVNPHNAEIKQCTKKSSTSFVATSPKMTG